MQNLRKNKNPVTRKSNKGDSVVVFDKADYLDKMESLLNDACKLEKNNLKKWWNFVFCCEQRKMCWRTFKKLVKSNSIFEETRRSLTLVGSRPGILYGLCKLHKHTIDNCLPFRPILTAIDTPTYNLWLVMSILQRTHLLLLRKLLNKIWNISCDVLMLVLLLLTFHLKRSLISALIHLLKILKE